MVAVPASRAPSRCARDTPPRDQATRRGTRVGRGDGSRWALLAVAFALPCCVRGFSLAPQVDMRSAKAAGSGCRGCCSGRWVGGGASSAQLRAASSTSSELNPEASVRPPLVRSRVGGRGEGASGAWPLHMSTASTGATSEINRAVDNAKRLTEGDLDNLELARGPAELNRRRTVLNQAYQECERITGIFAKTFYLGTKFMSPVARKAVWAIYVWCRRTDDIVDGPRAMVRGKKSMQQDLTDWAARLDDVWKGKPTDSLDLALVDVRENYPSLPIAPFKDMIDGMIMDVPGIGKNRYQTFEELELYCYRVAGTVGLMVLPILGTAEGVSEEDAKFPALSLGIALQLTNILRDVGEDAVRGRIYLPLEDLAKFGVEPENIMNGILDSNYKELMRYQIARARFYYKQAARGIPMLSPEGRLPVQASLDMYGKILTAIEANGYDNFRKRAYISKTEKLLTLPFSYAKSLNPGQVNTDIDESEFKLTRFDKLDMEREAFPTGKDEDDF
uniref:15-cis-phytoene synthase n=1 Tax=Scytosiphon lomentaria TaxID=27967 RepID=A0A2D2AH33_SCYLO|nr:phytoene synthetase [Scytosiphon lomentaria]